MLNHITQSDNSLKGKLHEKNYKNLHCRYPRSDICKDGYRYGFLDGYSDLCRYTSCVLNIKTIYVQESELHALAKFNNLFD